MVEALEGFFLLLERFTDTYVVTLVAENDHSLSYYYGPDAELSAWCVRSVSTTASEVTLCVYTKRVVALI